MRRCLPGDLLSAAACIAAADTSDWPEIANRLLAETDAAHRYFKRFGRSHPTWGNGSLMARANLLGQAAPDLQSHRFLSALSLICALLTQRKRLWHQKLVDWPLAM